MDAIPHGCDLAGYAMTADILAKSLGGHKEGWGWLACGRFMMTASRASRSLPARIWSGTRQWRAAAMSFHTERRGRLDFHEINRAALLSLPSLLRRWLPDGRLVGWEYTARNPTRADRKPGSFRINMQSGKWADFATGDRGGDVVSLAAYLSGTGQGEAAQSLSEMLGLQDG